MMQKLLLTCLTIAFCMVSAMNSTPSDSLRHQASTDPEQPHSAQPSEPELEPEPKPELPHAASPRHFLRRHQAPEPKAELTHSALPVPLGIYLHDNHEFREVSGNEFILRSLLPEGSTIESKDLLTWFGSEDHEVHSIVVVYLHAHGAEAEDKETGEIISGVNLWTPTSPPVMETLDHHLFLKKLIQLYHNTPVLLISESCHGQWMKHYLQEFQNKGYGTNIGLISSLGPINTLYILGLTSKLALNTENSQLSIIDFLNKFQDLHNEIADTGVNIDDRDLEFTHPRAAHTDDFKLLTSRATQQGTEYLDQYTEPHLKILDAALRIGNKAITNVLLPKTSDEAMSKISAVRMLENSQLAYNIRHRPVHEFYEELQQSALEKTRFDDMGLGWELPLLTVAVLWRRFDIVKLLVEKFKVNVNEIGNFEGSDVTALDAALAHLVLEYKSDFSMAFKIRKYEEIIEYLEENGAKLAPGSKDHPAYKSFIKTTPGFCKDYPRFC